MTGRSGAGVWPWFEVRAESMTKNTVGSGTMALSVPPGCIHREHRPDSVVVWLEIWPLKAMLLPISINASNTLRILCV